MKNFLECTKILKEMQEFSCEVILLYSHVMHLYILLSTFLSYIQNDKKISFIFLKAKFSHYTYLEFPVTTD